MIEAEIAPSSDLYSVGLVFYEMLTGSRLFAAESVSELLREQLTVRILELRKLGIDVPRCLDEILQRLLRKNPHERYQTAQAVLEDLQRLSEQLDRGETDPAIIAGTHDWRVTLAEPAFVGRRDELLQLDRSTAKCELGKWRARRAGRRFR